VTIAGQVAEDAQGNIVGPGDLPVQARQAFANVGRALAAGGARPDQVTKITIFVADYRRESLPAIEAGRAALFGDHKPADTLMGVAARSRPDYLIEVDAIAVTDG
jgi:enamine deaminase RidA (YjgF/YER057c/UK114 family)